MADVVERSFLVYLKENRDIGDSWRLVNAFLGGMAFYLCVLFRQYYRSQAIAYAMDQVREQAESSIDAAAQLAVLESMSGQIVAYYVILTAVLAALGAPVIAWGIRRGGPLRFFFGGVTVPALVFFIANRIG